MRAVEQPAALGWRTDLPAPAVGRAFVVLERVAGGTRSISALARELGVSKGSVHAVVRSLLAVGALATATDGSLRMGERLRQLANIGGGSDISGAQALLDGLARQRPELAYYLGVPKGDAVTIVARAGQESGLGQAEPVGACLPRTAGVLAKVLLAGARTPYACDDQEHLPGVRAVAAPVVRAATVGAVLWAVGSVAALRKQEMSSIGEWLRGAASEIAERL